MKKILFLGLLFSTFLGCYKDVDELAYSSWEDEGKPLITLTTSISGPASARRARVFIQSDYYTTFTSGMRIQISGYNLYVDNIDTIRKPVFLEYHDLYGVSGDVICVEASFRFKDGQETKKSSQICATL